MTFKTRKATKIFQVIVFCSIFIIIFNLINSYLNFESYDYREEFDNMFYNELEEDYADVLFFGASQTITTSIPTVIFEETGISSFLFSSSNQNNFSSYHKLKELLEDGYRPELVVIDTVSLIQEIYGTNETNIPKEEAAGEGAYRTGINYLNNFWNKEEYARNLANEFGNEYYFDYLFPVFRFHEKWRETVASTAESGVYEYYSLGARYTKKTAISFEENFISGKTEETTELGEVEEKYFIMMVELLKEYNIEVLAIKHLDCKTDDIVHNSINNLCLSLEIPFLNLNLDEHKEAIKKEYGFNYNEFFYDETHMITEGGIIISRYLGNYLKENYSLNNNRDDEDYYFMYEYHEIFKENYPEAFQ